MSEALRQAAATGYIITKEHYEARFWYGECVHAKRPYVRVTPRKTWCAIELDMEPCGRKMSEQASERLFAIMKEYWSTLPTRQRTSAGWGRGSAWISKVRIVDAPAIAEALLGIAEEDELLDEWERVACEAWEAN